MNLRASILHSVSIFALSAVCFAAKSDATKHGELYTFYGEVRAYDPSARTLTIRSNGRNFVFHVTNETRMSSFNGHVDLDKLPRGSGATVVMRTGEHGEGVALKIRFEAAANAANMISLFSAKTTKGETISGMAFNNYVAYQPPADAWSGGVPREKARSSMFLLTIQRDGTVSEVKPLRGLGYPELDERAAKWLKKWRFQPNSVVEARIPMTYSQWRY